MKKISLQSLTISSFTLSIAIFWKRRLPAIRVLSRSYTVFRKFTTGKWRQASFQPAFKLYDVLEFPYEPCFHSYRNIIRYIEKWDPQCKYILSTWDYLAEYFVKTDFIHLFEIFYRVLRSKDCVSTKIWPMLRNWQNRSEHCLLPYFSKIKNMVDPFFHSHAQSCCAECLVII